MFDVGPQNARKWCEGVTNCESGFNKLSSSHILKPATVHTSMATSENVDMSTRAHPLAVMRFSTDECY